MRSVTPFTTILLSFAIQPPVANGAELPKPVADESQKRPNIVVFLADDIGISGVSCYGSDSFKTPHIDKLAADGVRFDYGFSHPVCGPSRVCLMTGRYPFRTGGLGNQSSKQVSPRDQTPVSRLLQQAGYATFATGKWPWLGHMEDAEGWGFDEMVTWRGYGTPDRYWDPNLYINGKKQAFPGKYGPDIMQDAIFDFIDKTRKHSPGKPFFVYYPSVFPHEPYVHTPDSQSPNISKAEKYRDMIAYMDKQVGDLRTRLAERGLAESTLIIFLSDNGSVKGFKEVIHEKVVHGGKGQIADGGVRVPWICYWPGTIKPGRTTDALTDFSDLFPTLLDVARVNLPDRLQIDGKSFAPLLRGEKYHARDWIFYQIDRRYAVREHRWKLDHTDTLFDMRHSPHGEIPVDPSSDPEAKKAYDRLKAVMIKLDPSKGAPLHAGKPSDTDSRTFCKGIPREDEDGAACLLPILTLKNGCKMCGRDPRPHA